jgi:hypothetical protein
MSSVIFLSPGKYLFGTLQQITIASPFYSVYIVTLPHHLTLNNFCSWYSSEVLRFNTAYTKVWHWSRFIVILSSHLILGLLGGCFATIVPRPQIQYAFLVSPTHVTCPGNSLQDFTTPTVLGVCVCLHKVMKFSLRTSSLLCPKYLEIFSCTLCFQTTCNTCYSIGLLWNPKVHYRVDNSVLLVPILSQLHPAHVLPPYFPKKWHYYYYTSSHPISLRSGIIIIIIIIIIIVCVTWALVHCKLDIVTVPEPNKKHFQNFFRNLIYVCYCGDPGYSNFEAVSKDLLGICLFLL